MASSIPAMRGADVVAALEKWDFTVDRVEGSHHIMKHPDGRGTTVPVHNRDVAKGTMGSIMRDTGLTAEQLRNPKLARRQARELTPQEVAQGSAPAAQAVQSGDGTGRPGGRGAARQPSREKGERGRRR
ncbi:type II toxin-antitoxin system HicA family toxin [Kribbella jiaozuonensis]|uniref:Addiction module toxin, HicA family n=1 Tax=Kribbella jiaozuonensis TaxID=2575441 RepID=A0A4U3LGX5_9ACTN|nr:type II toxin-antitoxin system HicA family toxin [Kribbella jiaozuonensis]TKK73486.1 addiction module toxin, HicA family [Kribbella jiaozuonensis]